MSLAPLNNAAIVAQLRAQARALDALANAIETGNPPDCSKVEHRRDFTHHVDRAILKALGSAAWPLRLADLEAATDYSRRTLMPRLKLLELASAVSRPHGVRGGWFPPNKQIAP